MSQMKLWSPQIYCFCFTTWTLNTVVFLLPRPGN